jgi:ribosome-binding protein aMBF1 (putative translation factor)
MEPAELAQRLGIRRWSLVRLEAGQRVPSLRLAIVIEDATDGWSEGAIRPREWRETR